MFNHAGLQRTAVAVIGQEITQLQRWGQVQHHMRTHAGLKYSGKIHKCVGFITFFTLWLLKDYLEESFAEPKPEDIKPVPSKEDQLFYVQQGQEAMRKALSMLEDKQGWKVEITEVTCESFRCHPDSSKCFFSNFHALK